MTTGSTVMSVEGSRQGDYLLGQRRWAVIVLSGARPLMQLFDAGASKSHGESGRCTVWEHQTQLHERGERQETASHAIDGDKCHKGDDERHQQPQDLSSGSVA
jgi:hypothetical protein